MHKPIPGAVITVRSGMR